MSDSKSTEYLKAKIDKAHEMLEVQGQNGNWNVDPYMHGIYNGMEFMLALFEDREPEYRKAPEKWIGWDTPDNLKDGGTKGE